MKANFIEIVSFIVFAFLTLDKSVRVFALFGNKKTPTKAYTNDVVKIVNGIKHKRLGGEGEIVVSEVGLGTQRWVSEDFNAPDESLCHSFLDKATSSGINLVDTAEQYPIPSSSSKPEGLTETIIGNWGQSLQYNHDAEKYYDGHASFEEIVGAMGDLVKQGKIRGYGFCNDNCFGLTAASYTAKALGVASPVCLQNDYSLINRRIEENGVSEASSGIHLNAGFMAYNVLAGGILTGKYLEGPPITVENPSFQNSQQTRKYPRGRMDEIGWGRTLYRYRSGPAEDATKAYKQIADKNKISLTELALRFPKERRAVTTSLVGHSSMQQLDETIRHFQNDKALPDQVLWDIDVVHMKNRLPIFSSTRVGRDWYGEGEIGERIP